MASPRDCKTATALSPRQARARATNVTPITRPTVVAVEEGVEESAQSKPCLSASHISPIRAPSEMTDAIRRQKRTAAINYWRDQTLCIKPVYRSLLSGAAASSSNTPLPSSTATANKSSKGKEQLRDLLQSFKALNNNGVQQRGKSFNDVRIKVILQGNDKSSRKSKVMLAYRKGENRLTSYSVDYLKSLPSNSTPSVSKSARVTAEGSTHRHSYGKAPILEKSKSEDLSSTVTPGSPNSPRNPAEDPKSPLSRQNSIPNLTCLQFADTILKAAGSDIKEIYQVYKSKVGYADFLESQQKSKTSNEDQPKKPKNMFRNLRSSPATMTAKSSTMQLLSLPADQRSTSPYSSPSSSPVLRHKQVLPGIADVFSRKSTFSQKFATRWCDKTTDHDNATDTIDYDKPITIIVESSDDDKATRSILKLPKNSSTSEKVDLEAQDDLKSSAHSAKDLCSPRDDSRALLLDYEEKDGDDPETTNNNNIEGVNDNKERLVRFNVDHRIHEFVPLEPIASND